MLKRKEIVYGDGEMLPEKGWLTIKDHQGGIALLISHSTGPWAKKPGSWALSSKVALQMPASPQLNSLKLMIGQHYRFIHIEKYTWQVIQMLKSSRQHASSWTQATGELNYYQNVACWTQNNNRKSLFVNLVFKNMNPRAFMCLARQ